ncbi:hypothetical protein Dimus_006682 [Dionaea muscipula]
MAASSPSSDLKPSNVSNTLEPESAAIRAPATTVNPVDPLDPTDNLNPSDNRESETCDLWLDIPGSATPICCRPPLPPLPLAPGTWKDDPNTHCSGMKTTYSSGRVGITIFVDKLSENVGRRELLSIFCLFEHVLDVFIPRKRSRLQSKFSFVRFESEDAAGRAVLNVNSLKLMDRILHVKRAAFGKDVSGLRSRKVVLPPICRQERGNHGDSSDQRYSAGRGTVLSYETVLQGERRESAGRTGCSEPSKIVISDESSEVDRLMKSCVIEWTNDGCAQEEGFRKATSLMERGGLVRVSR